MYEYVFLTELEFKIFVWKRKMESLFSSVKNIYIHWGIGPSYNKVSDVSGTLDFSKY